MDPARRQSWPAIWPCCSPIRTPIRTCSRSTANPDGCAGRRRVRRRRTDSPRRWSIGLQRVPRRSSSRAPTKLTRTIWSPESGSGGSVGMAWQAKSTPVLDGGVLYVHSWMASPSELGLQASVPEFKKALEDWDANKDGKLAPAEVPDAEMRKLWFLFDLDKDGVLNEREWNVH